MVKELSVVGKRLPRWAAYEKATGVARFTTDLKIAGALVGRVLPSPFPHARIRKINTTKAKKMPGVAAVISFQDIPHRLFNPSKSDTTLLHAENEFRDMYVLTDKPRFVGDPVAAVAAVDAETAEKALGLIEIEYEVLPAVFDPFKATKPGAPIIHEFAKNNISAHFEFAGNRGDVEAGFGKADAVVKATFQTSKQHLAQLEPCSCVASFDANGRLTIWSASQHFFLHRKKLAEIFNLPEGMIRWINPHLGGGFGKYGSFGCEPICAALSIKAHQPVKLEYTREEDFYGTETREAYIETGEIGVARDGTIIALREEIVVHSGAYFTHSSSTTNVNMGQFAGLYRCPNIYAEANAVYTNIPPSGGCRGYGGNEAHFLLEQLVDMAAEAIGMDPLELRLKNIKKKGDLSQVGLPIETETIKKCIQLGAKNFSWKAKRARKKGKVPVKKGTGMAIFFDVTGAQPFNIQDRNVIIKLNEDGSANLIVGSCDVGQNLLGTAAQIAAETMGLNYQDIHIVTGDTDTCLFDIGQHANGGCYQLGNAVIAAALDVKRQILEIAAGMLDIPLKSLDIKNGTVITDISTERSITVADISRAVTYSQIGKHLQIMGKGSFSPTQNPVPFGAVFADVEVDTETGVITLVKILQVQDSGRMINPDTVEGQLQGAMMQGIGYTLTEDYYVNTANGTLESDNYNTYRVPSTLDAPEIDFIILEEPTPSGPFGAKGVGMCGLIGTAPAIANAVYNAIGVRIKSLPMTPEKVLEALKEKK